MRKLLRGLIRPIGLIGPMGPIRPIRLRGLIGLIGLIGLMGPIGLMGLIGKSINQLPTQFCKLTAGDEVVEVFGEVDL